QELTAPQQLEAQMKANGVPTTEAEINSAKLQTRWLLALALLVAFVGILNSMLMSVTERFKEIGTMKCLGALDSFIVKLFLIEACLLGVTASLIGYVIGFGFAMAAGAIQNGFKQWSLVPPGAVLLAFLACVLVGALLTVL